MNYSLVLVASQFFQPLLHRKSKEHPLCRSTTSFRTIDIYAPANATIFPSFLDSWRCGAGGGDKDDGKTQSRRHLWTRDSSSFQRITGLWPNVEMGVLIR